MLEQAILEPRVPRRWWRGAAVVLSITVHVAGLTALVAAAMWRMDKLPPIDSPVTFVASIGVSLPSEGPPRVKVVEKDRDHRRVVKDRQPADRREPAAAPASDGPSATDDGADTPSGEPGPFSACTPGSDCTPALLDAVEEPSCGNGRVEAGEACDDGGRAGGDGCSAACRTEQVVVGQSTIEARRIAGDPQIAAPDSVRSQMARTQQRQVRGVVHMCLDRGGQVDSVRVLRSTGYAEYDARLTERMRSWRYQPFRVNGAAVPVCSAVTFVYRMN
jgi:TonB family protein